MPGGPQGRQSLPCFGTPLVAQLGRALAARELLRHRTLQPEDAFETEPHS